MLTVLLSEVPKGTIFSVTTSCAAPIPRPPWVSSGFGWIASTPDDQVIYLNPSSPLIESSPDSMIRKLVKKGLVMECDDE